MKKNLAILTILAVLFVGCAFLQTAQDMLCDPPQSVIAVANAAAPLVATVINIALPGSTAYVTAVTVQGAITAIQGGACVTVTQLNALIAWIQGEQAKSLQAKAMLKAGPAKAVALDPAPLIAWRDSVK